VAQQVKAAHPGSLRLIYKSKRKNNRVDAGKLARLLYLDAVPWVYVPGRETRLWRQTIEFRQTLLDRLVTLKNQIRASLRERGIAAPKGLWTARGTTWFKTQGESDDAWALRRDLLIKAFYDRVTRNDPDRRKIAIVATAHHLTRVAVSMLKSGEVWREDARVTKGNGGNQVSGQAS
jgi:transposase